MSCIETMNLIDFGIEDVKHTTQEEPSIPSNEMMYTEFAGALVPHVNQVIIPSENTNMSEQSRESLDNNPFDIVQRLANRPDDPFEIVEKEACLKARNNQARVDVKLGKLLSLSDDNLLEDADVENHTNEKFTSCSVENNDSPRCVGDSTAQSNGTVSIYNTANTCMLLESESPPVSMSEKWGSQSSNSYESAGESASSSDVVSSAKSKKAIEYRKRLLKLSISNSTFHSPVNHRTQSSRDGFVETNNISMILTEAAQLGEHLIAAESPLKLVEDDLMGEEPNWIDSEKDFDDDLEMLKIPMLKELPSPVVEVKTKPEDFDQPPSKTESLEIKEVEPLIDLAAIRAKLKAKREFCNNNQDIYGLIDNLKSLISDIKVCDPAKKKEATSLLDALSSALLLDGTKQREESKIQQDNEEMIPMTPPPQPIVRQGTFDIELQYKEQQEKKFVGAGKELECQETSTPLPLQSDVRCEEMPDAMIRSSATYDGENADEKDFVLPEIQPLTQSQLDVNEIVEQIGKLLEQQQLSNKDIGIGGSSSQSGNINPTFIVVMNTAQNPLNTASVQQQCSYMAACLENSFNDASPTSNQQSNSMMRRRSQSLSIHDKVKVLQLPIVTSNVVSTEEDCNLQSNFSPETKYPLDSEGAEFKTPSRMVMRRNSFSSGTPLTPIPSNFGGMAAKKRGSGLPEITSQVQMRRSTVLTTHHEHQRNSGSSSGTVRPMQQLNLNALKTDLINKKKLKSSNGAESIFKGSGPMKATIPVKNVAPTITTKISPPMPDSAAFGTKKSSYLNSSMQLVAVSGKIPHTSTPMPQQRSAPAALEIAPGLPNACSTPSVRSSPTKRYMMNASRRSTHLPPTPSIKYSTSSSSITAASAATLRRRTLCELKSKSPIKTRISNFGGGGAAATLGKTAGGAKNSGKGNLNVSRTTQNKSAPTPNTRPSSRLSARSSFAAPLVTKRNKENKQPQ